MDYIIIDGHKTAAAIEAAILHADGSLGDRDEISMAEFTAIDNTHSIAYENDTAYWNRVYRNIQDNTLIAVSLHY